MNGEVAFWLILAIFLGVVEASTVNMVTIWTAISALITAIITLTGVSVSVQATIFVVLSVVLLFLTRPFVNRVLVKKTIATNADRIIGMVGIVVKEINTIDNSGQIKVMGQIWSAKTDDGTDIQEGKHVIIKSLDGVKAVVSPAE